MMRARLLIAIGIFCTLVAACSGAGSVTQSGSVVPTNAGQRLGMTQNGSRWQIFPLRPKAVPGSVAVGPNGKVWFTDVNGSSGVSKIGRISLDGHVEEFTLPTGSDPADIVKGPDGNMWFTEEFGNKVGRITSSGSISEFSPPASGQPLHITVGPDGALWFTEPAAGQIGRITTSGQITEFPVPGDGITTGPDGNLWASGYGMIYRVTPTGVATGFKTHYNAQSQDIVSGSDGRLWFVEWRPTIGYEIGRMTTTGVLKEYQLPGQIVNGLTSALGSVWFAVMTSNGSGIGKITPQGVITEHLLDFNSAYDLVLAPDGNLWLSYGSSMAVYTP